MGADESRACRLDHKLKSQSETRGIHFEKTTDDAIRSAQELRMAYRGGMFGDAPRPFVGWIMLMEAPPSCHRPIRDRSQHFPVRAEFQGASYIERYNLLCKKLVQEQLYTTTAVLASPQPAIKSGKFTDVGDMTSLKTFVTSFAVHIASKAAR